MVVREQRVEVSRPARSRVTARTVFLVIGAAVVVMLAVQIVTRVVLPSYDKERATGVPTALVEDARLYLADSGLFRLPEAGISQSDAEVSQIGQQLYATYSFAVLLGERFGEVIPARGLDRLAEIAADTTVPDVGRLRAYAALGAADDPRATGGTTLAAAAADEFGAEVTESMLPHYLETMEVAVRVDPDVPRAALTEFDVFDDASAERIGSSALVLTHLFSNADDVSRMFPELQKTLHGWLTDSRVGTDQFLMAGAAIAGSAVEALSSDEIGRLSQGVISRRGCGRSTFLLRSDFDPTICSITLTVMAQQVPGGAQ